MNSNDIKTSTYKLKQDLAQSKGWFQKAKAYTNYYLENLFAGGGNPECRKLLQQMNYYETQRNERELTVDEEKEYKKLSERLREIEKIDKINFGM